MKKLFTILCTVSMLSIGSLVQAQEQDTSTNYTTEDEIKRDDAQSTEEELEQATDEMEEGWRSSTEEAQQEAEQTGDEVEEEADKADNKASQATKTGAAHIKDEVLESKEGPNGETIFINEHAQYYYVDEKGDKVFVEKSDLKDKQR